MKVLFSLTLSFLLIVQALVPNMEVACEIEKLPELLAHFHHHQQANEISFIEFLVEDYVTHSGNEQEHHEDGSHDDLPFHGNHQCAHATAFAAIFASQIKILSPTAFFVSQNSKYTLSVTSVYLDTPFQPPQA